MIGDGKNMFLEKLLLVKLLELEKNKQSIALESDCTERWWFIFYEYIEVR